MMNDGNTGYKLWHLLDEVEDLLAGGYRNPHATPSAVEESNAMPSDSRAVVQSNPPVDYSTLGIGERKEQLSAVSARIAACAACRLHETRRNTVPGTGVLDPLVMIIGEGPGADEDASGLPFVGRAGQYLDKWLDAIEISRHKNAYIANLVKCRPPNNRDPQPDESSACHPFLLEQIALVRPKTILTVGRVASQYLIGRLDSIGSLRGRAYEFNGIPLVPTYHPSGVLRNPDYRRPVWEDMKLLRSILSR